MYVNRVSLLQLMVNFCFHQVRNAFKITSTFIGALQHKRFPNIPLVFFNWFGCTTLWAEIKSCLMFRLPYRLIFVCNIGKWRVSKIVSFHHRNSKGRGRQACRKTWVPTAWLCLGDRLFLWGMWVKPLNFLKFGSCKIPFINAHVPSNCHARVFNWTAQCFSGQVY